MYSKQQLNIIKRKQQESISKRTQDNALYEKLDKQNIVIEKQKVEIDFLKNLIESTTKKINDIILNNDLIKPNKKESK
tara:strand:- start:6 stop:239 length:234 start_codon:yes stop_codon:yes gene_type:complete